MTTADRDREAFEAWWEHSGHTPSDDMHFALAAWQASLTHAREAGAQEPVFGTYVERSDGTSEFRKAGAPHSPCACSYTFWNLYTHPAPAQEPVAVPGRDKMVANLISIADASRRADGSDIPLGETLRKAAAMLIAAPVAPPAKSGEVERLRSGWTLANDAGKRWRIVGPDGRWEMQPIGFVSAEEAKSVCETAMGTALASHTPAPQPGGAVKGLHTGRLSVQVGGDKENNYWWVRVYPFFSEAAAHRMRGPIIAALEPSPSQWNAGAEATKTKARPLDLATMLKHAWVAGKTGTAWADYDPTELVVYQRLAETLDIPLPTPAGEG